ncbi:MAG: peptidase S16 [Wenzhouxiangella sp.]|nr:MAG: peptidase S16 [Wenzhouxiangella sp.]
MTESLYLFPLNLVLLPGARVPLRIFESRYIDMVRDCLRNDVGFGVVWRMDTEPGAGGGHAPVGTEARIRDFTTLEDGLLGIDCEGCRRFRVRATRARDDGLLIGEVSWLAEEKASSVSPRHAALQTLMRQVLQSRELAERLDVDIDDASSLGFNLASLLPLDLPRTQQLLEMIDPAARLDALVDMVEQLAGDQSNDQSNMET